MAAGHCTQPGPKPTDGSRRVRSVTIACGLLVVAFALRADVFLLPHLRGDQRLYLAAALKLANEGIAGYNLRGTSLQPEDELFTRFTADAGGGRGNILRDLAEREGVRYYDMPLLTTPPLLSYALAASHAVFSPDQPYAIPYRPWYADNGRYTAVRYARKQFYAVVVPLLSSLLLVQLVFWLGRTLFNRETAAMAALLLASCPTDILTAQRIWADDLTALLVTASALAFVAAKQRRQPALAALAGLCAGLAATAKPTGGYIVLAIGLYQLWLARYELRAGRWLAVLGDRTTALYFAAALLAALPWYALVTATYGKPWYRGSLALIDPDAPWFRMLRERSSFIYLVNLPAQSPLFALAGGVLADLWSRRGRDDNKVLLLLWLGVYGYLLWGYREERYLLPALPAVALLAAHYLQRVREWCDRTCGRYVGKLIVTLALLLSAVWSVSLAREAVLNDRVLIAFPL